MELNALKQKGKIVLYILVLLLLLPLGLIAAVAFLLIPGGHAVSVKVILTVIGCLLLGGVFFSLGLLNKYLAIHLLKIKLCTFLFWAGWAIPVASISLAAVGFTALTLTETALLDVDPDGGSSSGSDDFWDWD